MLTTFYIIAAALLPVVILLWLIYRRDKYCPEPAGQLCKAFWYGIQSVFVSFAFSVPFKAMGLYSSEYSDMMGAFRLAFIGAATPEEIAKFIMFWLLVREANISTRPSTASSMPCSCRWASLPWRTSYTYSTTASNG